MANPTNSADLLASFNQAAPEGQVYIDERILVPEMESANLVVLEAELQAPELRTWEDRSFYSSQLAITFIVDEEEARNETQQDEPRLFHHVRVNCKEDGSFDWGNNIKLLQFFKIMGVKTYEGVGKARTFYGNPLEWTADLQGRSVKGKIVQEAVKAKDEETGEWTSYKLDDQGEPVLKNKISAFSSAG